MAARQVRRVAPDQIPEAVEAKPGTYVIVFRANTHSQIQVGSLGQFPLDPGVYIYVGSALGSGGVRARISRHLGAVVKRHWHIDYLRGALRASQIFFCYSQRRLEHAWALALLNMREASASIPGFGVSDCSCCSHLIFYKIRPDPERFFEALGAASSAKIPVHQLLIT